MEENQRRWHIDFRVEQYLDRHGVEWAYLTDVPITQIDSRMAIQNQARLDGIDKALVGEYAASMREKYVFPAIVVYLMENGRYSIMGGLHRFLAAQAAGVDSLDVYVAVVKDENERRVLIQTLNNFEGRRQKIDHRLEQAITCYENGGMTIREVANRYEVNESTLGSEIRARRARALIQSAGVVTEGLPKSSMEQLALLSNDNVLKAAAELQKRVLMVDSDLRIMMGAIREQRTEADQINIVNEWAKRYPEKRHNNHQTPSGKFRALVFRSLGALLNAFEKNDTRAKLGLSNDDDYRRAVAMAKRILEYLEGIHGSAV